MDEEVKVALLSAIRIWTEVGVQCSHAVKRVANLAEHLDADLCSGRQGLGAIALTSTAIIKSLKEWSSPKKD